MGTKTGREPQETKDLRVNMEIEIYLYHYIASLPLRPSSSLPLPHLLIFPLFPPPYPPRPVPLPLHLPPSSFTRHGRGERPFPLPSDLHFSTFNPPPRPFPLIFPLTCLPRRVSLHPPPFSRLSPLSFFPPFAPRVREEGPAARAARCACAAPRPGKVPLRILTGWEGGGQLCFCAGARRPLPPAAPPAAHAR